MAEPEGFPGNRIGRVPTYTNGKPINKMVVPADIFKGSGGAAPTECSLYDSGMCRRNANPGQTTDTLPICKYPLHAERCPDRPTQAQ